MFSLENYGYIYGQSVGIMTMKFTLKILAAVKSIKKIFLYLGLNISNQN